MKLYKVFLEATFEYGEGHCRMVEMEKYNETKTENYDCAANLGEKFLDFHLHKICYKLKSNEYIQSLQLIFKSRNDGKPQTLLDTDPEDTTKECFELEDSEEITEVRIWKQKDRLIGFEISTNKNRSKKIGYGEEESEKIKEFEQGDKIILGFGCQANKQYGVCSIYCYYLGKRKFGIIQNSGLLQLRSKLKKNPEFKAELKTKKSSLTEQQKLILDTCDLPDAAFFPFASYIMTY